MACRRTFCESERSASMRTTLTILIICLLGVEAFAQGAKDAPMTKDNRPDTYWKSVLTPLQYEVTRNKGTERAFSGAYWDSKEDGTYHCVCCGLTAAPAGPATSSLWTGPMCAMWSTSRSACNAPRWYVADAMHIWAMYLTMVLALQDCVTASIRHRCAL